MSMGFVFFDKTKLLEASEFSTCGLETGNIIVLHHKTSISKRVKTLLKLKAKKYCT